MQVYFNERYLFSETVFFIEEMALLVKNIHSAVMHNQECRKIKPNERNTIKQKSKLRPTTCIINTYGVNCCCSCTISWPQATIGNTFRFFYI